MKKRKRNNKPKEKKPKEKHFWTWDYNWIKLLTRLNKSQIDSYPVFWILQSRVDFLIWLSDKRWVPCEWKVSDSEFPRVSERAEKCWMKKISATTKNLNGKSFFVFENVGKVFYNLNTNIFLAVFVFPPIVVRKWKSLNVAKGNHFIFAWKRIARSWT